MAENTLPVAANNLLGIPPTLLPEDHPDTEVSSGLEAGTDLRELAARFPSSSLVWAELAREALEDEDVIAAYAFARTGYHRGLDALRRAGWRGQGPIPASHAPNRGFLHALALLGETSSRIGDEEEAERVRSFLAEADPTLLA
ncbi:DUF3151 domain-containing protein [Brachybacterium hainanense]|uniref:DUF3151 domain-containing protein n=1 Tax=Brachybacterium hainanense TaxID=1541174 RepID=A0ABV6RIV3_9MICO